MKTRMILTVALSMMAAAAAFAQVGEPYIHDPSTIAECDGKYYTLGTGSGGLISEDGWTWHSGAVRPGGGVAPDILKIGDRYLVGYCIGLGSGGHDSSARIMWTKTLDPDSPDFGYTEPVEVAASLPDEDCDAIDISFLLGPDGRLWCTYGTYFGHIRVVELDPKTGLRLEGNEPVDLGRDMEASVMIYRNGWYYLLGTHGTCCDGVNSTYNIVVGRSRYPQGPFIDNVGRTMLEGGGKAVLTTEGRLVGPGHFGRFIQEDGVEKMSFHWEADMDQSGRSVLGIRPLLWENGWPVAGGAFEPGTYEIQSQRSGYALELAVDFVRAQGGMRGFSRGAADQPVVSIEAQKLEEIIGGWPEGTIDVRNGYYMARPNQRWTITPVPEAGGYLGGPYYKITIEGTDRALAANADAEVEAVPQFNGADEQLWRIDQLTDGTFRIMPKAVPGHSEPLALVCLGDSSPTLVKFDFHSDNCKWNFKSY
ncbi:MAG: family 43 glycosylhydrolase [Bacteroidia bacterium]|nr:family 43 glycosylhydrolase [Bacteroidia bacterium]